MKQQSPITILCAAILGVAWFLHKGGGPLCQPNTTDWLRAGDAAWQHLGWLFFQRESWHLPLGLLVDYPKPSGTTVGYTDSIPWLALLCKLLSHRTQTQFQYFGPWFLFCFAMQGVLGARLVALVTPRRSLQCMGALFYAAAPLLIFRISHAALCAHFLLLAMLWLYLQPCPDAQAMRRLLRIAALVLLLAAGFHPYLMVMSFCLSAALLWRLWRSDCLLSGQRALGLFFAYLGMIGAVMALLGYFNGTGPVAGGDLNYAADLLTFFNAQGRSAWFADLPTGPGQYEGFAYLGAGGLFLVGLAFICWRTLRATVFGSRMGPLYLVVLAFAVFAIFPRITIAGKELMSSSFTFMGLTDIFHATGRFLWPLYYLVLTLALHTTLRRWQQKPAIAHVLVAAVLFLQIHEQHRAKVLAAAVPFAIPAAPEWNLAQGNYRAMVLYPPALDCQPSFPSQHVVKLGYLAYKLGMTINSAALARRPSLSEQAYCKTLRNQIEQHELQRDTVYIVDTAALPWFSHAACGRIDDYQVCVAADAHNPFRAVLNSPLAPTQ